MKTSPHPHRWIRSPAGWMLTLASAWLLLFSTHLPAQGVDAEKEGDPEKSEITGEIRDPKKGEVLKRNFTVKGRTRGAPQGYVAMLFRNNLKDNYPFPHYEYSRANRSFSVDIHHDETDPAEWEILLYVLPEEDAKKLAAWVLRAGTLSRAGRQAEIEPLESLMPDEATLLTSVKYFLE